MLEVFLLTAFLLMTNWVFEKPLKDEKTFFFAFLKLKASRLQKERRNLESNKQSWGVSLVVIT